MSAYNSGSRGGGGGGNRNGANRGGGGRQRLDAKTRTMNKFTVYDADVGSQYDYEQEEEPLVVRRAPAPPQRGLPAPRGHLLALSQLRQDSQLLRGASGSDRKELVQRVVVRNAVRNATDLARVMRLLAESVDAFHPIAPRADYATGNVDFFLRTHEDAEAVRSLSRRLVDKQAGKLTITASRTAAPWEQLRPNVKQLIEQVVRSRYNTASNSLDLSDFSSEKEFAAASVHCPLFNNAVATHVAHVITRHFATICGLSLRGNRLRSLDYASTLVYAAPAVSELDLSSNALTRMEQVEPLRGWPIEKLHLENNELISRYADGALYASAVHDIFPRVNYLDGVSIAPKALRLDEDEASAGSLPAYRAGFCPDEGVRALVENFLLEYLALYDGPSGEQTRKQLMNAYDDSATLTFAINILRDTQRIDRGDEAAYTYYLRSSHNILHMDKWCNYRDKIVYRGAMDVAVALSKLPLTNHVKESFILDFNHISSAVVSFTLQGVLRDGEHAFTTRAGGCKFFSRNLVVVPKADGKIAIISDMLTLSPVGAERLERYNGLLKKAASTDISDHIGAIHLPSTSAAAAGYNPVGNGGMAPPPPPTPQPGAVPDQSLAPTSALPYDVSEPSVRKAIIEQFSTLTGMKAEWAEKCLLDNDWNFEAAQRIFRDMRASVPAEAFKAV